MAWAKYSSYATTPAEGLGFAIPINDAFSVAKDLMTNGSVTNKAYIGITATTVSQALAQQSELHEGVYVYSVELGSAAEIAGLQTGNVKSKQMEQTLLLCKSFQPLRTPIAQAIPFSSKSSEMTKHFSCC